MYRIRSFWIAQHGLRYPYTRTAYNVTNWPGTFHNYNNVNKTVILYLPFHIFYNYNISKYLNIWNCTSQIDVFVLVLLCISEFLRMAPTQRNF